MFGCSQTDPDRSASAGEGRFRRRLSGSLKMETGSTYGVSVTKSERLMLLINMLKTRRVLSVPQMSASCEVTERTIYRDLCSLSRMNIPVYYDKGYRLAHEVAFPCVELGAEDLELLCFCLRFNPLTKHAFFAHRFRMIERKVRERIRSQTGNDRQAVCVMDMPENRPADHSEDYPHVARFLTAIFESAIISIQLTGSKPSRLWHPVALKIRNDLPFFLVTASPDDPPVEIAASRVSRVRMTSRRFDLQILEQYRRRWLAGLSSVDRTRRPAGKP